MLRRCQSQCREPSELYTEEVHEYGADNETRYGYSQSSQYAESAVDCRAALWEGGLDGPIGTGDIDSQRDVVSVLVPLGGPFSWPAQEQIPVAGSKIRLADGRMVHVTEVQKRVHCIAMEGRTA